MFKKLKIIELASVLAGPSVGQFFAELGAQVIKIENPKTNGDVTRSWKAKGEADTDISAYFSSVNWGKQSLTLDISQTKGLNILYQLIGKADMVITSYKPGDAHKLKVDYQTLKKLNAGLIYGEITGYGSKNSRVGYDAIIQAESGFMFMNGQPDGPPTKMPVALIDVLAGHHLKEALLVAVINRISSGEGGHVSVSLMDAALSSLVNQATNYLVAGNNPERKGSIHPNIAPYGELFETKDGEQLLLAVGNDKQFKVLCAILELPELAEKEDFANNPNRVANRAELEAILKNRINHLESGNLLVKLNAAHVPAGLITSVADAFDQQDLRHLELKRPEIKGLRGFAAKGLTISSHILPPPKLGEHNQQVLVRELGFSDAEINHMTRSGII